MAVLSYLHHIWLTRRNKIRQAVSFWMAVQTGHWSSAQTADPTVEPEYHFEAIDHLLQEIVFREAVWEQYFTDTGIKPLVVVYEDFRDAWPMRNNRATRGNLVNVRVATA